MTTHVEWTSVKPEDVNRADKEYDAVGDTEFFARHGFAPTTTYDLIVNDKAYPPKAILGAAFEFATGRRLASADFEGGRSGAVKILTSLGFDVRERNR
jgi:hypothetical protein